MNNLGSFTLSGFLQFGHTSTNVLLLFSEEVHCNRSGGEGEGQKRRNWEKREEWWQRRKGQEFRTGMGMTHQIINFHTLPIHYHMELCNLQLKCRQERLTGLHAEICCIPHNLS